MCWFKKKNAKKVEIFSKYKKSDFVNFRHKNELYFGWIWTIYHKNIDEKNEVYYDIQLGGQCPCIVRGISEKNIIGLKRD